jgi:hypothetical protein
VKGDQKKELIIVILALTYLKEHTNSADIEEFDRMIETTDFMRAESKIKERRMAKLMQW